MIGGSAGRELQWAAGKENGGTLLPETRIRMGQRVKHDRAIDGDREDVWRNRPENARVVTDDREEPVCARWPGDRRGASG